MKSNDRALFDPLETRIGAVEAVLLRIDQKLGGGKE